MEREESLVLDSLVNESFLIEVTTVNDDDYFQFTFWHIVKSSKLITVHGLARKRQQLSFND